jgi:hypothetical protein
MQSLREDMIAFSQELSGVPIIKERIGDEIINVVVDKQKIEDEIEYQKGLWKNDFNTLEKTDWRLQESYRAGPFNDWVYSVFESVVQLLKELNAQNTDLIEGRFIRLKKYYYEMRNQPRSLYGDGGALSTYEKAFNKHYYSK